MHARDESAATSSLPDSATMRAATAVFSQRMTFTFGRPCKKCAHWLMACSWE